MKGLLSLLFLGLAACASQDAALPPTSPLSPVVVDTSAWPAPVGEVTLQQVAAHVPGRALDVSIVLFDPGLPADASSFGARGIFPAIRRTESRYLPVLLRQALVNSGAWGVVRILPEAEPGAELLVTAGILHSDGRYLALDVQARDASGETWLQGIYTDVADAEDYPAGADDDPFADLYRQIANDLLSAVCERGDSALARLRRVAELRYASDLAPEAFAGYLGRGPAGQWQLQRLPAEHDPMLARVMRLREQQFRFVDMVDEQYLDLLDTVRPTYNLWRQYGHEQARYIGEHAERLARRESAGRRGSFSAMQQSYNAFRWRKIQEQDLRELAGGFNNEVAPTVMDVRGRVFRLSGSLGSQYREWQTILRDIFRLEAGLPGTGPGGVAPAERSTRVDSAPAASGDNHE